MSNYEIERKFLLKSLPPNMDEQAFSSSHCTQHYFPGEKIIERVTRRQVRICNKRETPYYVYNRTVKIGEGIRRLEFEEKLSKKEYENFSRVDSNDIVKVRWRIKYEGFIWEIDKFVFPIGTYIAEVELESEDQPYEMPDWIIDNMKMEVTGMKGFHNFEIARNMSIPYV